MKGTFVWRTKPEDADEFARRWAEESAIFQSYAGALGTQLSTSLTEPGLFLGYASWLSLEHRTAARHQRDLDGRPHITSSEISDVIFDGYWDEPEIVIPTQPPCGAPINRLKPNLSVLINE